MKKIISLLIFAIFCLGLVNALEGTGAVPEIQNRPLLGRVSMEQGSYKNFDVKITATETGYFSCEVGLFSENTVRQWFGGKLPGYDLFTISPWQDVIGNCVQNQNFVTTKSAYLVKGASKVEVVPIFAPQTFDKTDSYVVYASCFNHCYLQGPDNFMNFGADTVKVKLVAVVDVPPESNHCMNFKTDSDESDFDCEIGRAHV